MNVKSRPKLMVGFDAGTSLSKTIYSLNKQIKYTTMGAQSLKLPNTSKRYLPNASAVGLPEDNAWIEKGGEVYAIGRIAKEYRALTRIKPLKANLAVPKIMATIGAIAKKEGLGEEFDLDLGILLPYSEITSKQELIENLLEELLSFNFQDRPLSVRLNEWDIKPEGSGIAMLRYLKHQSRLEQITQIYLMLGHRNTTLLVFVRGSFSPIYSSTTNYGFYDCLDKFREKIPGIDRETIMQAMAFQGKIVRDWKKDIYSYTDRKISIDFSQIIDSSDRSKIQEANRLFFESLEEYWALISDWLDESLPVLKTIDELCICGGASVFLMSYLGKKLGKIKITELGDEINDFWKALGFSEYQYPQELIEENLIERMLDVWGMFAIFSNYFDSQGEVA